MKSFEKAIKTLEFDKIRSMLAECAPTEGARAAALALMPSKSRGAVLKMQEETEAAHAMQTVKGMPPFCSVTDISAAIDRAEKGAMLTVREILEVCRVLTAARALTEYRNREQNALDNYFDALTANKTLENKIARSFDSDGNLNDTATDKLYDIRRKIRTAQNRVRDSLQKYISGEHYSKYLQEQIITVRNGRFVIPVKAEYKNEIKGLVHDSSSSGATLFIEPVGVVEANNEIRILERAEADEVERYLFELSSDIAENSAMLRGNHHSITTLALIFAKSQLSFRYSGTMPKISEKSMIRLKNARHPLLGKDTCVPISISIGEDFDCLVITGPNTGGKTVSLKTAGLFALMAQAGLQLPVGNDSELGIFEDMFADIGDDQSIEQSLSTFSSHMVNIVSILENLRPRTLVLFDELCAGTDPVEGAALAVSILESVRAKGALCAATTHYAELKIYALDTDGVCNASCEFDISTLRPTYKLVIGAPGKSNAFAISGRLGLPDDIIRRAETYVSGESKRFENAIERLEQNRVEMEKRNAEAEAALAEVKRKKAEADAFVEMREKEAEKELEKARAAASRMIQGAKASSDFIMEQMEKVKKERESENLARSMEEARRAIRLKLRENSDIVDPVEERAFEGYKLPRPLKKLSLIHI